MTATATETLTPHGLQQLLELPLEQVIPSPDNPRRDLGDVAGLAMSIKTSGLWQPIVVSAQNDDGTYTIIAGHRRRAACELAALDTVTVIVRDDVDEAQAVGRLIENVQREDLSPLEEARGYQQLLDEFRFGQRDLAERVGRSQGHVSKRLALLQLPKEVQDEIDSGGIPLADAAEYAKLAAHPERLLRAVQRVEAQSWESAAGAVEKELDALERQRELDAIVAPLEAAGKTVVRFEDNGTYDGKLPRGVRELVRATTDYGHEHALVFDPKKHETEECHAIAIHPRRHNEIPVCTNRANHPKAKTVGEKRKAARPANGQSQSQKEEQVLREELTAAQDVRRTFLVELLAKKSAFSKTEALELALRLIVSGAENVLSFDNDQAVCELVGCPSERGALSEWAKTADVSDLTRAVLAVKLFEEFEYSLEPWGRWNDDDVAFLELLKRKGYQPTEAEIATAAKVGAK